METARRGRLTVSLGAAPGVGKTYAMLDKARRRCERGTDVVVGYVETHGHRHTEEMLADLEVVPRAQILREVWGPAYDTETHHLRVYAAQLRRKLEADPAHPRHLITSPGLGYTLEP